MTDQNTRVVLVEKFVAFLKSLSTAEWLCLGGVLSGVVVIIACSVYWFTMQSANDRVTAAVAEKAAMVAKMEGQILDLKKEAQAQSTIQFLGESRVMARVVQLGGGGICRGGIIENIWLGNSGVTDADLEAMGRLTGLGELDLQSTKISDQGLKELQTLNQLSELNLDETPNITDDGIRYLPQALEKLHLQRTQISDAGLGHLSHLTSLQALYLGDTQVTPEGVKQLQQKLPACTIKTVYVKPGA